MKRMIIELANKIGIKHIGVTHNCDKKSVITALFPYYVANETGNIAMYARGRDYHNVAREKLEKICELLKANGAELCHIQVDNGPLDDRKAAYQSGLGFYGRHGLLINPEYGSYFVIGQIITDLDITVDAPMTQSCLNCDACITSCPTQALTSGGLIRETCISHISQSKSALTDEQTEKIKRFTFVYGCDICQAVCPHNKDLPTTAMNEFLHNRISSITLKEIETLNNKDFMLKYKDYAFAWRGKAPLERNLKLHS